MSSFRIGLLWFLLNVLHSSLLSVERFMQIYCEISCACFMCAINDELLHKQCLKCKHFSKYKCKTEEKTIKAEKREIKTTEPHTLIK